MMGAFQKSFGFDKVEISKTERIVEQRDQVSVLSLDNLKSELENIFKADIPEGIYMEESNLRSVILDDSTVVTVYDVNTCETAIQIDDNGIVYLKDGKLESNITYELNGNIYRTDEKGRIICCIAYPETSPENPRDVNAQLQVGGEDRRPSDQGGHIIGRDLNGDGGAGNLVAMDSKINQSDYKRMENDIKAALDKGEDVAVTIEISYSGESKRPDSIIATVSVHGMKTIYKFDNNLDGNLRKEVPLNGKDAVQQEINDTNGEISSIKEEYDENGNLTETIVNITYTEENGTNHRTKVYIDPE